MQCGFLFEVCQHSLLRNRPVMNLSQARDIALAHDRKPQPAVHKAQSQRHYRDFLGYAGSLPLSKLPKASPLLLSSQPHLIHVPGLQAGRGEQVGTLNPIQRSRPQGKEERKIYTVSTSLLYVQIYSLTQRKADLELRTPQLLTGQSDVYKAGWYF